MGIKPPVKTRQRAACFVYVLGCRRGGHAVTYVGWTLDVARRLTQHNAGKGARFTRGRQWVLLHVERCATRRKAMSREWHLKRDRNFRRKLVLDWASTPGV
ncbi:MAG: GIY-YIG nuclease family protein [Pseudorhodoplanes sp.]